MPASTPIARSKTAALSRIIDTIPKGYSHYTSGVCKAAKADALARKFHQRYGIGATPAQRVTRKRKGEANTLLVMFWPSEAAEVHWLLLTTPGSGPVWEQETLRAVTDAPHLTWLGYELVRRASRGRTGWTWCRPKTEMADWYALLGEQLNHRHFAAVGKTLARAAHQPGFAGVREQTWALCQFARGNGYGEEIPHLYFVQKVAHGDRLAL